MAGRFLETQSINFRFNLNYASPSPFPLPPGERDLDLSRQARGQEVGDNYLK
jgi:hypothetical protein